MASNNIMDLLQGIIGELKAIAKSETVVGQPVQAGDRTVIPVTRITVGFGAGGGEDTQSGKGPRFGGGGGGGAVIDPVAFLVLDKDKVSLVTARQKGAFEKVMEAAPDVLATIKSFASKKDDKDSET
ncbi:MAG: spore germination protein GerW family protein [Candidatus Zixiibacteriota bacterium]